MYSIDVPVRYTHYETQNEKLKMVRCVVFSASFLRKLLGSCLRAAPLLRAQFQPLRRTQTSLRPFPVLACPDATVLLILQKVSFDHPPLTATACFSGPSPKSVRVLLPSLPLSGPLQAGLSPPLRMTVLLSRPAVTSVFLNLVALHHSRFS